MVDCGIEASRGYSATNFSWDFSLYTRYSMDINEQAAKKEVFFVSRRM